MGKTYKYKYFIDTISTWKKNTKYNHKKARYFYT